MEKLKDIHDVSSFYFFVLCAIYVVAALSFRNEFLAERMVMLMRILDIPLILICLSYGGSSLALQLYNESESRFSPWVIVVFLSCLIIFLTSLLINFLLPNQL